MEKLYEGQLIGTAHWNLDLIHFNINIFDFSLPDGHSQEIHSNMSTVIQKCDEIQSACSDHFAITHLKTNLRKIAEFLERADKKAYEETPIILECNSSDKKRILDETFEHSIPAKRIKYESPLMFQRNDSSNDKYDSYIFAFNLYLPFYLCFFLVLTKLFVQRLWKKTLVMTKTATCYIFDIRGSVEL